MRKLIVFMLLAIPCHAEEPAAPAQKPANETAASTPRIAYNEMEGTILSCDMENRVLRITTANGFNVEFGYTHKSVVMEGSHRVPWEDVQYGDRVLIRYAGRDLTVREIERVGKSARSIPDTESAAPAEETGVAQDTASVKS